MILRCLVHHASELSDGVGDVCTCSHCTVDERSNDLHVPALVVHSERLASVVNGDLERRLHGSADALHLVESETLEYLLEVRALLDECVMALDVVNLHPEVPPQRSHAADAPEVLELALELLV